MLPEDVQAVLPALTGHRLPGPSGEANAEALSRELLASIAIP